ncbi:hypothetical protein GLE_1302 [Lysobacter enzymogenes]|uniref:Uncharacterized protein n=1 Tax=Lysobacter enzymogenes TaxID=69 RepID=A0A0S2DDX8_LYSEN|nr:hypothetical protein GLE_1302 [Lysobacter enzymogenes]
MNEAARQGMAHIRGSVQTSEAAPPPVCRSRPRIPATVAARFATP